MTAVMMVLRRNRETGQAVATSARQAANLSARLMKN
jgi:hypothetical protein